MKFTDINIEKGTERVRSRRDTIDARKEGFVSNMI